MSSDSTEDKLTIAADGQPPTQRALKECAEAMVYLTRNLGWPKRSLPEFIA